MSETLERVMRLAEALCEMLDEGSHGMDIPEVHAALATFINMVLADGEVAMRQRGLDDIADHMRGEFIRLLAES